MSEWISVEDDVPKTGTLFDAWTLDEEREIGKCYYGSDDKGFMRAVMKRQGITHWMPSPEPPK